MAKPNKFTTIIGISILSSVFFGGLPAHSAECTQRDSSGHCLRVSQNRESTAPSRDGSENQGNKDGDLTKESYKSHTTDADISQDLSSEFQKWVEWFNNNYEEITDEIGAKIYARKTANRRPGEAACHTEDMKPGEYARVKEKPIESTTNGDTIYCKAHDTKTLTPNNPTPPKGPTIEEMLQEIEDQFANTNIQAPVLKQSYNLGTGLGENNPNVYKNQAVNFYVDAPTARWEGDLMIGHVEIESYPTQMTIQYGNGDEDTFYTMGKPVSRARGEESRKTATSYVYKRSGNFHAYATVSYSGRFRVNGGDWQALDVVLTKDTVDPLLVRVWWVDVGRVAGDCSYDDTRWGCKNDPTMGKPDNPNPRLRKADIRTGQRWHLNDSGDGDTEYSLHRDWPDM